VIAILINKISTFSDAGANGTFSDAGVNGT
jgi:hypothetical protein